MNSVRRFFTRHRFRWVKVQGHHELVVWTFFSSARIRAIVYDDGFWIQSGSPRTGWADRPQLMTTDSRVELAKRQVEYYTWECE